MKLLAADRGFLRACKTKTDVQAGFLAIDPRDGQIRAWVGSRDFTREPFDHVAQARRQPARRSSRSSMASRSRTG